MAVTQQESLYSGKICRHTAILSNIEGPLAVVGPQRSSVLSLIRYVGEAGKSSTVNIWYSMKKDSSLQLFLSDSFLESTLTV